MYNIPFIVIFVPIVLIIFAEFILFANWTPFFFRTGIPLYRQEFRLKKEIEGLESYAAVLEREVLRHSSKLTIIFRALSSSELAFRQRFGQRRNQTYGLLVYDSRQQLLTLTGYLPWSTVVLPILFIILLLWVRSLLAPLYLLMLFLVVGFAVVYQYRSYGRIAEAIQQTFQLEKIPDEIVGIPNGQNPSNPNSTSLDPFLSNFILFAVSLGILALFGLAFLLYLF